MDATKLGANLRDAMLDMSVPIPYGSGYVKMRDILIANASEQGLENYKDLPAYSQIEQTWLIISEGIINHIKDESYTEITHSMDLLKAAISSLVPALDNSGAAIVSQLKASAWFNTDINSKVS